MAQTKPNSTCPMCGNEFHCGVKEGVKSCWCFELPPMEVEVQGASHCLCFTCLRKYGKPKSV